MTQHLLIRRLCSCHCASATCHDEFCCETAKLIPSAPAIGGVKNKHSASASAGEAAALEAAAAVLAEEGADRKKADDSNGESRAERSSSETTAGASFQLHLHAQKRRRYSEGQRQ